MTNDIDPGERAQPDRAQLEALVRRARTELREWTDANDSDPGQALVDLLAYVGDLLATQSERLADEGYLASRGEHGSTVEFGDGAHGRRLPTGDTTADRYRSGAGHRSVHRQQGRVGLDPDLGADAASKIVGVHRAIVVDDQDPLGRHRVRVQIPSLSGDQTPYAAACLPVSGADRVPSVGDQVWVAFEAGDPAYPVWLGVGWR